MEVPDMSAWAGLRLVEQLEGGHRNEVWRGELDGAAVAVRRSRRSPASLAWELDVIERVGRSGVGVADVLRSDCGDLTSNGVVVQRWIEGRAPSSERDWRLVAEALQHVHMVPASQRPGACVVTSLADVGASLDADLGAMPSHVRDRIIDVFATFADAPVSLIHGDPNPSNIVIEADGTVVLLDWDESRVDLSWHDLSNLAVQVLDDETHARAQRLSHAWEAANAWLVEPGYARSRLAELD